MTNRDTIKLAAENIFNKISHDVSHDGTPIDTKIFEEEIKKQFGNFPSDEIRTEVMKEINELKRIAKQADN